MVTDIFSIIYRGVLKNKKKKKSLQIYSPCDIIFNVDIPSCEARPYLGGKHMAFYEIQNLYEEHLSVAMIRDFLNNYCDNIGFYAFIKHDKDIQANGDIKKAHYHLVVEYVDDTSHTKQNALKTFKCLYEKVNIQSIKDTHRFVRYLTHKDNPEKFQYNDSDVITNAIDIYNNLKSVVVAGSSMDALMNDLTKCLDEALENNNDFGMKETIQWFQTINKLSYYITHKKNIDSFVRDYLNVMRELSYIQMIEEQVDENGILQDYHA